MSLTSTDEPVSDNKKTAGTFRALIPSETHTNDSFSNYIPKILYWYWIVSGFGMFAIKHKQSANKCWYHHLLWFILMNIINISCLGFSIFVSISSGRLGDIVVGVVWSINMFPCWILLHVNLNWEYKCYQTLIVGISHELMEFESSSYNVDDKKIKNKWNTFCRLYIFAVICGSIILIINGVALAPCSESINLNFFDNAIIATWFNICSMYCLDLTLLYQCILHVKQYDLFNSKIKNSILTDIDLTKMAYKKLRTCVQTTINMWSTVVTISVITNAIRAVSVALLFLTQESKDPLVSWCTSSLVSFILEFSIISLRLIMTVYGPSLLNTKFDSIPQTLIEQLDNQNDSKISRWYLSVIAKPIAFRIFWINIRWTLFVALVTAVATTLCSVLLRLDIEVI